MQRPSIFIQAPCLLLCVLALGLAPAGRVGAPALQRSATVSICTASPVVPGDPLSSFFMRFEQVRDQALRVGSTTCLSSVAQGSELASLLGTVSALRLTGRRLHVQLQSFTIDAIQRDATGVLTVEANVDEIRTALTAGGAPIGSPVRDDRAILYRLSPASPKAMAWYVQDDALAAQPPLPAALKGTFVQALDGVANRSTVQSLATTATGGDLLRILARNGFAVHPQSLIPDFFTDPAAPDDRASSGIYARNTVAAIPSIITIDSALHVYHLLQSRVTLTAELTVMPGRVRRLLEDLLVVNADQESRLTTSDVRAALERNSVYLGVADLLVGGAWPAGTLDPTAAALAAREANAIRAHLASMPSPYLSQVVDYRTFVPTGHYALDAGLTGYFQALRWLQVAAPRLSIAPEDHQSSLQAVLLVLALREKGPHGTVQGEWRDVIEPIAGLTGAPAGSMTALDRLVSAVYGNGPATAADADPALLSRVTARVATLSCAQPGVCPVALLAPADRADEQFIARAGAPSGLDLIAAYGSAEARILRRQPGGNGLRLTSISAANPSLYAANLDLLHTLTLPPTAQAPAFMQTPAWQRMATLSSLGWWSEIHQDPQPLAGLIDARPQPVDPTLPPLKRSAYVEPLPAAWQALAGLAGSLATLSRNARLLNHLSPAEAGTLLAAEDRYTATVTHLAHIAQDEVGQVPVSQADAPYLGDPDRTLGAIALVAMHHGAVALRVAGSQSAALARIGNVLEAGEGPPQELWAIVPIDGQSWLARGAVYSYYEFGALSRPVSDAAWGAAGWNLERQPAWAASFER